jgi:proline dehydrogenase
MLRSLLIYLSQASWARRIITGWPFAWRTASRFIAGETLADAVQTVKTLNAKGVRVTLDHLGEHTSDAEKAEQATKDILGILEAIHEEDLAAGISLKLTQIGLALDRELCSSNLARIVARAKDLNIFVRIDMEDSPWTEVSLELFEELRYLQGFDNLGIVIQSYLFRSEADIRRLTDHGAPVRLCKGAYSEPPEIAFPKKKDVDQNFDRITAMLIDGALDGFPATTESNGRHPPLPAIATHDDQRIVYAKTYARKVELPRSALEFQMLHGIRRDLVSELIADGYPVRVYVPYGKEWYPYFMRRLAERPANLWFFISNLLKN